MIFIGVDPGKSGGYAIIAESDVGKSAHVYPWDDAQFAKQMAALMQVRIRGRIVAAVEKVGAMPGQGVTSMFSFGKSAGYIEGVLTALGIPYQLVLPKKWKAEFALGKDKQASIVTCRKLFPGVSLRATDRCRTDSDGMAEALLMAEYARRKL